MSTLVFRAATPYGFVKWLPKFRRNIGTHLQVHTASETGSCGCINKLLDSVDITTGYQVFQKVVQQNLLVMESQIA
jgi:hypothetical protein